MRLCRQKHNDVFNKVWDNMMGIIGRDCEKSVAYIGNKCQCKKGYKQWSVGVIEKREADANTKLRDAYGLYKGEARFVGVGTGCERCTFFEKYAEAGLIDDDGSLQEIDEDGEVTKILDTLGFRRDCRRLNSTTQGFLESTDTQGTSPQV